MKTEISRNSHQSGKRYAGVYQQQGRMLTDADWNELVDILKDRLNDALKDVVGNREHSLGGTPRHRALGITKATAADPLRIEQGQVYVDGYQAEAKPDPAVLPADSPPPKTFDYDKQLDFPSPPDLPGEGLLYVDVWERTVTHLMDPRLRDKGLHGADTSTRKQVMCQVKCGPDSIDPENAVENPAQGSAELTAVLLQKSTQQDPCDPCAAKLDVASRVGNYLFRVEVHDVKGAADKPTEITLKWSSENGAMQFEALPTETDMPDGFVSDKWIYEFFDRTSEKHLGVHFGTSPWEPVRSVLKEIAAPSSPYGVPAIPGSGETQKFVRRWDGYCTLDLSAKTLKAGVDRGVALSTSREPDALGFVRIDATLQIVLTSIKLDLALDGKSFVAGDYWLAEVREAEHDPLDTAKSTLVEEALPRGITHRYLTVGRLAGGMLQENPERDRKYAFPPLTEMTRLFMAGGDGQEVVPGMKLPQPLRVGVSNGEWPVQGATVRFKIEDGGDSLNLVNGGLTDADGIAACEWKPGGALGATCRVKATLVDPQDSSRDLALPPVYFYANLVSADQVAYAPACADSGENTLHSLLAEDATVPLELGDDGYYTVKEMLDALGCHLRARHIPYDPSNLPRWTDINEEEGRPLPDTVQTAIDALLENLHSEDIAYSLPDCSPATNTLKHHLQASIAHRAGDAAGRFRTSALWDALLCHLDAGKLPFDGECPNGLYPSGTDTVAKALESICQIQAKHIGFTKTCNTGIYKGKTATTVADVLALLCDITASQIAYKKPPDCTRLSGVTTVQGAIDQLCKTEVGDSCCVTVGPGTPFATIGAAIEKLVVDQGRRDLCLCLRPGFYEEEHIKLVAPDLRLKIAGSGKATRIAMKGPWQFGELAFFQLKDVELASSGVDAPLQFMACREVDIQSCGIEGRFTKGALLTLEKAERIGLRHCQLVVEKPDTRNRVSGIFDKLLDANAPSAIREVRNAILPLYASSNRFEFESKASEAADLMTRLDASGQTWLLPLSERVFRSVEDTRALETAELALYRDVVSLMVREDSGRKALIAKRLNEIRLIAAATADMTAVALMDGLADTRIVDCRIYGNIGLYGTATKPNLSNSQIKLLGAQVREQAVRFPRHNGRLRISASTVRRIWLSKEVYDRLKEVAAGNKVDFSDIFSGFILSENVFGANHSWLLSGVLTQTANDFDLELKQPADMLMATAVNADAIYTANRAPDASALNAIASIRNLGFRDPEAAANMLLKIAS